jgi:hypothetical protein
MLIKNNRNSLVILAHHATLMPGVNDVPDGAWKEATKILSVRGMLKEGILEKMGIKPFSQLTPSAAVKVVSQTYSEALLNTWGEKDKRPTVQEAIRKQRKLLELPTRKRSARGTEQRRSPVAQITKADVLLIAPELTGVSDAQWAVFIADAYAQMNEGFWGTRLNLGAKYLVAHAATMGDRAGASGSIQSEKVGEVSIAYHASVAQSVANLDATSYGQEYKRLLHLGQDRFMVI